MIGDYCAMKVARVLVALVAVAACAWFVVGIRQAHGIDTATSILTNNSSLSAAQERHVRSSLDSVGSLYPGIEAELLRGRLAFAEGHTAQARRIFAHVGSEEPDNVQGWLWLARTGGPGVDAAFAHVAKLVPKVRNER
jgi:hypothetical protein